MERMKQYSSKSEPDDEDGSLRHIRDTRGREQLSDGTNFYGVIFA